MSEYAGLLAQGAAQIRKFMDQASSKAFEAPWLERLATDMETASALTDQPSVERAIDSIARRLVDSGPVEASPSFSKVLDVFQRSRKKRHV